MSRYIVQHAGVTPELQGLWSGPAWGSVAELSIDHFHPRSSCHRPQTRAKLLFDADHLYAIFDVRDRFVRCVHTEYESDTYKDSCVELFLRPREQSGYFAIEINCGGAMSLRYIEDPRRTPQRFAKWTAVADRHAAGVRIAHNLPALIEPEIAAQTHWWMELACPVRVFEPYCGSLGALSGQTWRANFFKCADECSHPHWGSWASVGEELNFHRPEHFGEIQFQ